MTFPILGGNGAVAGAFSIDNSLRLNDDDTPKLAITPNASNRKTWTFSAWVKRSSLSSNQRILSITGTNDFLLRFRGDDKLSFIDGSITSELITATKVFRDTSAWYHIVIVLDTTQGTASNRAKLYVNGYQETDLVNNSGGSASYPSQNADGLINSNVLHTVGCRDISGTVDQNVDGYMAEVNLIDGQALSPTDFGEFDEDSGIWKPIRYSGSYGTNGFKLNFSNSGSLGADSSGNGNNFTATNLASTDQMIDTPQNNFNTLNPLSNTSNTPTLSEGNLDFVPTGNGWTMAPSTFMIPANTGKWYAETVLTYVNNQSGTFGIVPANNVGSDAYYSGSYGIVWQDANVPRYVATISGGIETNKVDGEQPVVGDIFQVAFDSDNGKIWFGKNNTWRTGNPSTDTSPTYTGITGDTVFVSSAYRVTSGSSYTAQLVNFGQDSSFAGNKTAQNNSDDNGEGDFFYAPPTGFLCLNSTNLATELSPTIDDGSQYFNTTLVTSTGSDITINTGFKPDFLWTKSRSYDARHELHNTTSGDNKRLVSNLTSAEETFSDYVTFLSDGATFGTNIPHALAGSTGRTGVAWSWRANAGTTSSNTSGSITSTVQANTTAGFSIVTYTGNGSDNSTIGHGLGKAPSMIIIKGRNSAEDWMVYHKDLTAGSEIKLNSTSAQADDTNNATWGDNHPSSVGSSTFAVGYAGDSNGNGTTYIAYCFAEIEGYSKFGSYTGNGSTNGAYIHLGFRPSFVMTKRTDSANQWTIFDSGRDPFNVVGNQLAPSSNAVEEADASHSSERDFLSNGFKMRAGGNDTNASGGTYVYMAIAENPFVDSNGVPNTAR